MASVRQRGKNFQLIAFCGYEGNKKIIKTTTYKYNPKLSRKANENQANIMAAKFEEDEIAKYKRNSNIRFSDYAEMYLNEAPIKEKTLSGYKSYLPRINEFLGDIKLADINIKTLESFYKELSVSGRRDVKYTALESLGVILKDNNITIKKLVKKTKLSTNTISACVNGKSVSEKTATTVAKVFNENLSDLFRVTNSKKSKLSSKTIRNYHRFISAVLSNAVHEEILTSNPCANCRLPVKSEQKETKYLTEEEAKKICDLLKGERLNLRAAVIILLESGLRRGELLGLKWDCIDFDNNLITVKRNLCYTSEKGVYVDTVKTKKSNRIISLPKRSMNLLRELKAQYDRAKEIMKDRWVDDDFVFIQYDGNPIHPDTLSKKIENFLNEHLNELPKISLHGLRHTHATLLIYKGVNVHQVASRLGHSSAATTMNVYAHALQKADAIASNKIEEIFK